MDGQGAFKLIHKHDASSQLEVDFDRVAYARAIHPDPAVESLVAARWEAALGKNRTLFNASKFRFAGIHIEQDSSKNNNIKYATVRLGLTDYATFVGTHSGKDPLREMGRPYLASPIGNAIVARTRDGYYTLLKRNTTTVGEGRGAVVFPGGHPEPGECSTSSMLSNECVKSELWNAARREVIEELFVADNQLDDVSTMRCLGLVAREHDGKVCQIFQADISADKHTVLEQYTRANILKEESTHLILLDAHQLRQALREGCVGGSKIMPEHLGAIHLWNLHSSSDVVSGNGLEKE